MVTFAYFFSSLCLLESTPRKGLPLSTTEVTAPVKVLQQTACCVHATTSRFILSLSPPHLSHGDGGAVPSHSYKITALFFLSSFFPNHLCKQFLLKLFSNYIIKYVISWQTLTDKSFQHLPLVLQLIFALSVSQPSLLLRCSSCHLHFTLQFFVTFHRID